MEFVTDFSYPAAVHQLTQYARIQYFKAIKEVSDSNVSHVGLYTRLTELIGLLGYVQAIVS